MILEIILIWNLSKKIAEMAKNKGRTAAGYVILFIVLWFAGEFAGAIVGAIATEGEVTLLNYVFALVGAAVGAGIAFAIVGSLPAIEQERYWDGSPSDRYDRGSREDRDYGPAYREKFDYERRYRPSNTPQEDSGNRNPNPAADAFRRDNEND